MGSSDRREKRMKAIACPHCGATVLVLGGGRPRVLSTAEEERIFQRWKRGETQAFIAAEMGVHRATVRRTLDRVKERKGKR